MLFNRNTGLEMSKSDIKKMVELHEKWLHHDTEGVRADFTSMNLESFDFSNANLKKAIFRRADLTRANFSRATLSETDFRYAYLDHANLIDANLYWSDLSDTNFDYADLSKADMGNTNLDCSSMRYANLTHTNLTSSNLQGAELQGANMNNAIIKNANLKNAELIHAENLDSVHANHSTNFFHIQCPEEGSFIGYKRAENSIVKLKILEDSKRSSATSRKCRCDKAEVLSITDIKTGEPMKETKSYYDYSFIYKVGETVSVEDFNNNRWVECTSGIHFFITRDEALNYQ